MNTRPLLLIVLGLLLLGLLLLLPTQPAGAEARQGQDFLTGNGTAGPYSLSWKNVLPGTESVRLNEASLTWGVDYTFDPVAGTVTFTRALPAQSAVVIRYGYDTAEATPQGGAGPPLSLALNDHVSLDAQYAHDPAGGAKPGALGLGLAGGWQGAQGSRFATRVLFAPAMAAADAAAAPNGLARLGLAASGQTGAGRVLQLGFGLSRAGAGVGALGGDSWQAGSQKVTLNGTLAPARSLQAKFDYTQTDAVTPDAPGAARPQAQLDTALTLTPSDKIHVQTTLAQTAGGGTGPTQNVGVTAAVAATKTVALTAGLTQLTRSAGDASTQSVGLALTPRPALQIDAGLSVRRDPAAATQTASVDGKAQPWKFLQVSGGYQWRAAASGQSAPAADPYDSSAASVTLLPLPALHLVGTYAQNPDDGSGSPQRLARRGLGLETRLGALSLSGGYDWSSRYDAANAAPVNDASLHLGVGLRFSADTKLTGDYKQYLAGTLDSGAANAYSLGLTRDLGDRFNLSLSGTMQQPVGPANPAPNTVTAAASLGVKF